MLRKEIKNRNISLGGNLSLKIYGRLGCNSGKRMKKSNRVFFRSKKEALELGFRPCGHCMKIEYKLWKDEFIST
jgi:methylphosphotriester-DNA--protein-cysteine methyltransferase